jgi:hypothetical protein
MRWTIRPFPRPGRIGSPHRQVRLFAQAHLTLQTLRPQDFDVESPAAVAPDHHPLQSVIRRSGVVAAGPETPADGWWWPATTPSWSRCRPASGYVRVAGLAYLPGISVEITSPPLMLAVFDANTTT